MKTRLHGWLILQEAICYQIKASARTQNLRSFADKALANFGGLNAPKMKGWIRYNQVKTLRLHCLSSITCQYLHICHATLFDQLSSSIYCNQAGINHGYMSFTCYMCDMHA